MNNEFTEDYLGGDFLQDIYFDDCRRSRICSSCKKEDDHTVLKTIEKNGFVREFLECTCGKNRVRFWKGDVHYGDKEWDAKTKNWSTIL